MTFKASTADLCDLIPIQVQERALMKHAFLRLPHRKSMGKFFIGCKCHGYFLKELISYPKIISTVKKGEPKLLNGLKM